ncbi:class I SAM-dependent methyltransferase [bacterium]|nr:class I SAM-dependent methyltransferase [bacterium]
MKYISLSLLTAAVIFLEFGLIRLFSAIFYFYSSYLVIAIALCGIGTGAIIQFLKTKQNSIQYPFKELFYSNCILIIQGFILPFFSVEISPERSLLDIDYFLPLFLFSILNYIFFSLSGVIILWHYKCTHNQINKFYASDISGCLSGTLIYLMIMPYLCGSSIFFTASLLSLGSYLFQKSSFQLKDSSIHRIMIATSFFLLVSSIFTSFFYIPLSYNGNRENILFCKWNCFSRITITEQKNFNRGISEEYYKKLQESNTSFPDQYIAHIDVNSYAPFFPNLKKVSELDFMKSSIENIGYHILHNPEVLILGSGSGKDICCAVLFNSAGITGIEINPILINEIMKNWCYGKFYKNLGSKNIKLINADGFTFVNTAKNEFYDIILLNTVISFASSASGVDSLSENLLYCKNAFSQYNRILKKEGIISVSLHDDTDFSITLRLLNTFRSLEKNDIKGNIAIIGSEISEDNYFLTCLYKNNGFSVKDINIIQEKATEYLHKILYLPGYKNNNELFSDYHNGSGIKLKNLSNKYRLEPVSVRSPFFFYNVKFSHLFSKEFFNLLEENLGLQYLFVVFCIGIIIIFIAIFLSKSRYITKISVIPTFFLRYFILCGTGYMTFQISMIQVFKIYFTNPTDPLLFVIPVLFTGMITGSFIVSGISKHQLIKSIKIVLVILSIIVLTLGVLLPGFVENTFTSPMYFKLVILFISTFIPAVCIGILFPSGLRLVNSYNEELIPWVYGINSLSSFPAAAASILIMIFYGYNVLIYISFSIYFLLLFFIFFLKNEKVIRF